MDLSALGNTLPPGLADAEREMGDKFRASALSITNLYKSSLSYTKQAYQVGYSACLADVLSTVQSSIGAGQDASQTLSRLMDWAEARQTAMAAFAAEEDDTSLNTPAQPQPHRRAALTRHQIHLQTSAANRPSSAPIPESYYSHQTPGAHPTSDMSPGPSRTRMHSVTHDTTNAADDGAENHAQAVARGDPDRTFVQGSTPISVDASPVDSVRPTVSANPDNNAPTHGTSSSSPTVAVRPIHGGNGRISRSPLRYRHDTPSASTSSTLPSLPFAPVLPANLAHPPSQQTLLSLPQLTSTSIPIGIGSKRPITAVHLDPDLDVAMTDDGISGVATSTRGGRASKRRNLEKRGESRDARDGDSGGGDGSGKEREERRRGRKGKDVG